MSTHAREKLAAFKRFKLSPDAESFRMLWEMQEKQPGLIRELFAEMEGQLRDKAFKHLEKVAKEALQDVPFHVRKEALALVASMRSELTGPKGEPGAPGKDGTNGRDGRDGTDGKSINGKDGQDGKDGAPGQAGPPGKDGSPDTPEQIAAKLNTLEEVVDQKAIKGLGKVIAELKEAIRRKQAGGSSGGGGMGNLLHESKSVSSATTSVQTNSKIAGQGYAIWAYYQGQLIVRGTHYTVGSDQKTLDLLFTPQDSTTIDIIYHRT